MDEREWARDVERAEREAVHWCTAALRRMRPERSYWVEDVAGGSMAFTGRHSPFSRARGLGMDAPVSAQSVRDLEAFFRGHGAIKAVVDVSAHAHPSLSAELAAAGFAVIDHTHVLGLELACFTPAPHGSSSGLRVERATLEHEHVWALVAARGFEMPETEEGDELDLGRMLFHAPGALAFWALRGDEPIATAGMAFHGELAALFAAGTVPSQRGQGAQQALLQARLVTAREAGSLRATVAASPGSVSERNVQRAGFRVLYERVSWAKTFDVV